MYSAFQLGIRYLKYYLTASNGKGHGVHSPFVFDFITKVLNDDREFYAYRQIENLRKMMQYNETSVVVEDLGAGSRVAKSSERKVKEIARGSLKPKKYGQLLFRMADYYAAETILELGTSLGITTAYLASARNGSRVITLEGAEAIATQAIANFNSLQLRNIELIKGDFDDTLSAAIKALQRVDLAFIDGNHAYKPTVNYYRQLLPSLHDDSILVFDDIHWSREMEKAWDEIRNDERVTLSIDLFFIGVVFFRKENKVKQHFTIRF
jgi:predicted O-methyltransferase YrrM